MQILRGIIPCAKKVVIYGPEGIGKSTLAAAFPDALFSDTEGSTNSMNIARFQKPTSWQMLKDQIAYVKANPGCCKTYVIDTIDWAEQMCIESICDAHDKKGIEDFGYGNGYVYVREEFGRFLNSLSDLVEIGINVVLTAHAQMRKFEQPDELGAYDRWELKLGKKTSSQTSPLVKEWADMLLFCNYKTMVVNVDGKGAQKGKNKVQGGQRVMYTAHHSCWDAKNRYGLPEELPMNYDSIRHVIEGSAATSPATERPAEAVEPVIERPSKAPEMPVESGPEPPMRMETYDMPQAEPAEATGQPEQAAGKTVSMFLSDPSRIPRELRDLMEADSICEWNIQDAVFAKGYYPENTLIQDMDPAFVQGVLIAAWAQVRAMIRDIQKNNGVPFN